jgi:Ethylbenzene dehydrogenase
MKNLRLNLVLAVIAAITLVNCTHDDAPTGTVIVDEGVGESSDELLVKKFSTAPIFDGDIDEVWSEARPLINVATVLKAGDRVITLNGSSNGDTSHEPTDLMDPYTGEKYNYSLRGGHDGEYFYLLFEWDDDTDSKDRQSWYFDPISSKWKGENKYANHKNDKFYEDKFSFMFGKKVNGQYAEGFEAGTCTVTCHAGLADPQPGQKTSRHYMANAGELADFWHWKRVRNVLSQSVDDGFVQYEEDEGMASANGRKTDEGSKMYGTNKFTDEGTELSGPKYVIKDAVDTFWYTDSEISNGTAQAVTAISTEGVLTLADGSTIDPNDDLVAYSQGFGNKRFPSVYINPAGAGSTPRTDTQVRAKHIGSGWQIEIKRKLNSGDPTDTAWEIGEEIPFSLAIFNNAAIGHAQSPFLTLKIEE